MRLAAPFAFALLLPALSGCFGGGEEPDDGGDGAFTPYFERGLLVQRLATQRGVVEAKAAAGALSTLAVPFDATVSFPENIFLYSEGRFAVGGAVELAAGGNVTFLPPPGLANLTLALAAGGANESLLLATPANGTSAFVSGDFAVYLEEVQREHFPQRAPGTDSYVAAQEYFRAFFERHGFEVTVEPVVNEATEAGGCPTAPPFVRTCPNEVANVVAYRRGSMTPEKILAFGAHYDVVTRTVEGAFDNTAGTVEVLELARAFANVTTDHSLLLALWGGEESGLLGSQFWVRTHPHVTPLIATYVNLDVSALAWPAPFPAPDMVASSAGPDGPLADRVNAGVRRALELAAFPPEVVEYRQVGQGQTSGGVDAQSDHTSFIAQGVPSAFLFDLNESAVRGFLHQPRDTLDNLVYFAATGVVPEGRGEALFNLSMEERALGRQVLEDSFATFLWLAFYLALHAELEGYDPRLPQ